MMGQAILEIRIFVFIPGKSGYLGATHLLWRREEGKGEKQRIYLIECVKRKKAIKQKNLQKC